MRSTVLLTGLLLASCGAPGSLAPGAAASLEIPARYDASAAPVPRVADSLLGLFDDARLKATVRRALANNPDLKGALARLEEAGYNTRKTASALYPALDANASAGRSSVPATGESASYRLALDARWELDVWGRIRAGVQASAADQAAAAADYESARQSLAAQTMQAWFDLVSAEKRLALGQRRVASFENTRNLVARRFELGTARLGDVELARTDLENGRADIRQLEDDRDRAARTVRLLAGDYPDARLSASSWSALSRSVPAGVPSDVLRQRPDIDAAYQRLRAADARVKVAHADLFPSFPLTASGGRSSNLLSDLGHSAFDSWSLLASLSAPIFDGGERRAEIGAAGKRAEQALANYQSIVLGALKEVEDALGSERLLRAQEQARLEALEAARSAETRTRRDYEAGISDFLTLLEAQRRVFSTEDQTLTLHRLRLQNRVSLALALGKGI
ncbi:efflux transporter outer membrane subunit [Luteolibacter marinus]|uniref:efflux transporter outer membrane subunit n=1 Tax=Luteolibacter marinus TaxID=2776705 RepID=UPI0018695E5B|nr:efflux transporter outer membrane subunit [Luteolibacter marinus]